MVSNSWFEDTVLLLSIFVNYYIMRDKERQETVKTHSVSIVFADYNQLAFEKWITSSDSRVILSRMVPSSWFEDTVVIYLCQLLYIMREGTTVKTHSVSIVLAGYISLRIV